MTFAADWQQDNMRHLSLAMGMLRLRLQRAASDEDADDAPADALLAEVNAQLDELEQYVDPAPALCLLAAGLGLTRFERDVILLCAGMELDTRIGPLCAAAQAGERPYPTFGLALSLFDEPEWSALAPHRPLRAWRLLDVHQPAATPLVAAALRIDERVLHYLKGLNEPDDRLTALEAPVSAEDHRLPPSQQAAAEAIVRAWTFGEQGALPVVQLTGGDAASKLLVAAQAAEAVGRRLFRLPAEHLADAGNDLDGLARLWQRESRLLPLALYLDADGEAADAAALKAVRRFLSRDDSLALVAAPEPVALSGRSQVTIEVSRPTSAEQREAWQRALGPGAERAAGLLAGQFQLNLPAIARAARVARAADGDPTSAVWQACRDEARPRTAGLAHHVRGRVGWDDLVLPAPVAQALRQLAAQVRDRATVYADWGFEQASSRGLGISALFSGASGTGKTMAAEVIANELGLDLYRIDLSSVVNKYVGETEKNLRRLFDSFEESGAVLFFDEADSLFGKRSEVRDSHDRYANLEVSYLLQRMETYRGLAILATNFKSALDTAFLRRLRFVIDFPTPGTPERQMIWSKVFPAGAEGVPTEGLEYRRLAKLDLTGGHIYSAALNAAFRAAAAGRGVTMADVMAAARDEYAKLDRQANAAEFLWEGGQ